MKKVLFAMAILGSTAFASNSFAASVYAPDFTCADLKAVVAQQGRVGIQMKFGYAEYASSAAGCYSSESVGQGTVFGTKDAATCNVGVTCTDNHGHGNG